LEIAERLGKHQSSEGGGGGGVVGVRGFALWGGGWFGGGGGGQKKVGKNPSIADSSGRPPEIRGIGKLAQGGVDTTTYSTRKGCEECVGRDYRLRIHVEDRGGGKLSDGAFPRQRERK